MIQRVRHEKITARIQRHTPRIRKAPRRRARPANDFQRLTIRIKHLNPAVPELADELIAARVHSDVVGITQLAQA